MAETQIRWVKAMLTSRGYVTRNEALRNYISRLGAIIYRLKQCGWVIDGMREYYDPENNKKWDYKYILRKKGRC